MEANSEKCEPAAPSVTPDTATGQDVEDNKLY